MEKVDISDLQSKCSQFIVEFSANNSNLGCTAFSGMRFNTYHGHFLLRSSDLMALPAVDCDKAFAMQMILEESLLTMQTAYLQAALLYPFVKELTKSRIESFSLRMGIIKRTFNLCFCVYLTLS